MGMRQERVKVFEMTCTSCENRAENAIKKLDGVLEVNASFSEQYVDVEFDDERCDIQKIKEAINEAGYSTQDPNDYKIIGILIIAAAVVMLGLKTSRFDMESKLANASYLILFVIGILTSFHCAWMCGGIMLSQSISGESKNNFEAMKPALLYNLGRVISYTVLGGIIGALGFVFSLSLTAKAGVQIIAGVFIIMMGFNMAGFSVFRKIQIRLPSAICKMKSHSKAPFVIGLLNGLMPCGPLQTMQLFALGTGSMMKGALAMFVFSMGTVPLMLTFGALSGVLSKGYTKKILKFSGILIIMLGVIMGNRGLILAGVNINPLSVLEERQAFANASDGGISTSNVAKATLEEGVQVIRMTADNNGYSPNVFYVQKGIPVKWVIDGKEINYCNNAIVMPVLNIEQKIRSGENIIEFTPGNKDILFSCWMGMIRGVIKVVDEIDSVDTTKEDPSLLPPSTGPSCCAVPIDESAEATPINPSIYGSDITMVPTEELVTQAEIIGDERKAVFKGIGYELKPLIVVTENGGNTKLTFDLSKFDNAEGEYVIVDAATGEEAAAFNAETGINEVAFNPKKIGGYAILKGSNFLGLIEVVDKLETADSQEIREKYLP